MTRPRWITATDAPDAFPPLNDALSEPDGLLAIGGDLSPQRLLAAYARGIFPWYESGQPILWWSPNPRLVLFPEKLHISRSLSKVLRKGQLKVTADTAFNRVIHACGASREHAEGTWITTAMKTAYAELFTLGYAHSIEVWNEGELVGGLYGIALGKVFFGESMFSLQTNASKVAFVHIVKQLEQWSYNMIDCQVSSQHLFNFGAEEISRSHFQNLLLNCSYKEAENCQLLDGSNKNASNCGQTRETSSPWKLTWRFKDE